MVRSKKLLGSEFTLTGYPARLMDDIARSVRHVHNQRTRARDKHADPLSEDCERAPLVVSHDVGFRVTGGELVVEALVRRIRDGARGVGLVRVCVEERSVCGGGATGGVVEVDCHGYPEGVAVFDDPDALQARIVSALNAGSNNNNNNNNDDTSARGRLIVSLDGGVSSLACRHGARRVAALVDVVRRHPAVYCVVIGCVHGDMHESHEVALLCRDALAEVHVLADGAVPPSLPETRRVLVRLATSKGCLSTERCTFKILGDGTIEFGKEGGEDGSAGGPRVPPPVGLLNHKEREKAAGGSHRSRLEAERRAKGNVVLPYERQGHARAFAADADFREYLPVEAGGWMRQGGGGEGGEGGEGDALMRTTHRLGTIKYLRGDSDDESFDSDEDPDDDIDI